jgi:hypothetical protein
MTKEQKQLIFIAVGLIIFGVVVLNSIREVQKKKSGRPAPVSAPEAAVQQPAVQVKFNPADNKVLDSQKKRSDLSWGRDPFLSDIEKGEQIKELKLKGISFGRDKRGYAFINEEIVGKGDKLGDYEVVDVEKERVLLKKGASSFYLTFPAEE